jgi:Tol biopolymer transport system component
MDADGGHVSQLTNNGEVAPDWSPDGTRLLFWPEVTRGFGPVSLMKVDGSDVRTLGQGSLPVWSPDGARIAFERQNGICVFDLCGLAVYVMNADGSDARQIKGTVTAFDYAAVPEWSPDGSRIVYLLGDYSRLPHARIMTTEGLDVIDLGVVASQAIWSPDGAAIAFTAPSPGDTAPIMVVPATGGTPVELVTRPGVSVPTDWR